MCEYTQKPRAEQIYLHHSIWRYKKRSDRCERSVRRKLFAAVQASSNCECRKARIYLQIEFDKAIPFALPRREQYMRQAECSRIYAEVIGANCLQPCRPRATVSAARHLYLQMEFDKAIPFALPRREQYMWPSGQIYAEAVSQLKQAEFYSICGKRSAAEYTQSEIMLAS